MTNTVTTIPADTYHADLVHDQVSLSASIAHTLLTQSPAHAWVAHPRLNPDFEREDKEHFEIGTVAHAIILEGTTAAVEVIDADDWRTKAAKEARDTARAAGRVPLLARHWDAVQAMVEAAGAQLALIDADPPLFTNGKPEQTLAWQEDGVSCRARLDWLHDDHSAIDDYKTTSRTASPEAWARAMFSSGRDLQAAFYLRGLRAVTGADAAFRFVIQETFRPYALAVVGLAPSALALANEKVERAIDVWRRCVETDTWPAYTPRVAYAELPAWVEMQWLERDAREAA